MRRDDVVKRLEKMGYKVTYLFNGKLMVLSKKWTRVYNSANEAYECLKESTSMTATERKVINYLIFGSIVFAICSILCTLCNPEVIYGGM